MMIVTVFLNQRFCSVDGVIWGPTDGYRFWNRYLEVFDAVKVVARVRESNIPPSGWQRADGKGVTFIRVPYYVGPWQYLFKLWSIRRMVLGVLESNDAIILRVPSQIATIVCPALIKSYRPYGVEVIADPDDFFRSKSKLRLNSVFRSNFVRELKRQCKHATVASYVTEKALQAKYPPPAGAFVTHYSSVELLDSMFVRNPRRFKSCISNPKILTVGSLESFVKGVDLLIEATVLCLHEGLNLQVVIVGEGRYRGTIENSLDLRCRKHISFLGQLSRKEVLAQMESADLFVLPSRSEGLPAVLIEAMAKGLPCISTHVGGIPELLPAEDLVPPEDGRALGLKILEIIDSPGRLDLMSTRNLRKAYEYKEAILGARRRQCYTFLRNATEKRLSGKIAMLCHTDLPPKNYSIG